MYVIRIIGGAVALNLPISKWILLFSLFLFLSLASVKRFIEVLKQKEEYSSSRPYRKSDKNIILNLSLVFAALSILIIALYIDSISALRLYSHNSILYFALILFLYWIFRIIFIAYRGEMSFDPVKFALKDKISYLILLLLILTMVVAK